MCSFSFLLIWILGGPIPTCQGQECDKVGLILQASSTHISWIGAAAMTRTRSTTCLGVGGWAICADGWETQPRPANSNLRTVTITCHILTFSKLLCHPLSHWALRRTLWASEAGMMIGKEAIKTLDEEGSRYVEIVFFFFFFKETCTRTFIAALFEIVTLKIIMSPWLVWLSGLSAGLWTKRLLGSNPSQGTCLGCRSGLQLGACEKQLINVSLTHQCFSPILFLPFPSL